ncbi:MAG: response regulator transcription factor [Defluviitaleaceae bacterium]|nr:response regulator transcription factor [Defluviitaleaceae bacterium]
MPTIFVVEDDRHIREVVTEYFKDAGFNVVSATCGTEAQKMIQSGQASDLFILDIMLPGIDGLALLKILREDARYRDVPVMMLTAASDEYTQLQSFENLADDYVTKPFSPKILVKRAEALLRRGEKQPAPQAGGVSVDAANYMAYEDGRPVKLTLREFELLKLLTENPGRVLTRQSLLDSVWGHDYFGDERVVDVHIKNLRKKFRTSVIETVTGVGYRGAI